MTALPALRPALVALVAVLFSLQAADSSQPDGNYNITGMLDSLLLSYDKRLRPNYGGQPVDVGVTMYVLDVASLSEKNMEYTLDFYMRMYWRDTRLSYGKKPGLETISLGAGFSEHIWLPDMFIVNERRSHGKSPHTSEEFIRIDPTGRVLRSVRISVTASCRMSLHYFPMDRQICGIDIESYGHTMQDLRFKWNEGEGSVGVDASITLPQFKVIGFRQKIAEINLSSGNYSRLSCEFQFVRYMGHYVMQIYVPAALIVVISWSTFWLERGSARVTRVALGAISVLTMTALMSSTNTYLPRVSYLKATDLYLGVCFVMVSAALIEYAVVCYMLKSLQAKRMRLLAIQQMAEEQGKADEGVAIGSKPNEVRFEVSKAAKASSGSANGHADKESGALMPSGNKEEKLYGIAPSGLDKYSRTLFPIAFICFNLIYWVIFLHIGGTPAKDMILL